MVLTTAMAGLVYYIDYNTKNMLEDMNVNYLETDYIEISPMVRRPFDSISMGVPFQDIEIEEIIQSDLFKNITPAICYQLRASFEDYYSDISSLKYIEYSIIIDCIRLR